MEFIKNCAYCGIEFTARYETTKYCKHCRQKKSAETRARNKAAKGPDVYKPQSDNASIIVLLRKIARYNKEHGTNLSYGKYVLMMSQGKAEG